MSDSLTNYHEKIPGILDTRFIYYDDVAHALATGLACGKNVLMHGPGGHAKSEMIEAALRGINLWDTAYLESFGEGLTEDTLWGGINLDAMNRDTNARIEYHPEFSFLNSETAVFEEMLDAPSPVLLGLKDTLTRGELRKGPQRFKMKTRVIIAATNHQPDQYADSDDPADKARVALLERFPIHVEVKWPNYKPQSYLAMFKKHDLYGQVGNAAEKLAHILAEATREGHFVSPRTAVHALEMVYQNSLSRGHGTVQSSDIADIRCLAGLDKFGQNILEDIEQISITAEAQAKLSDLAVELAKIKTQAAGLGDSAMKIVACAKEAEALKVRVFDVQVSEDLHPQRDELANKAGALSDKLRQKSWDLVKINGK